MGESVEEKTLWLHRKGAAPTDKGCVVIPGSRGSYSYLVKPNPDELILQNGGYSCAVSRFYFTNVNSTVQVESGKDQRR